MKPGSCLKFSAARIWAGDLAAAQNFYSKALGLVCTAGGVDHGYLVFDLDRVSLIVEFLDGNLPPEERALAGRFTGLSFAVDDIRCAVDELHSRGVTIAGEPEAQSWGGWLATFLDPAGNQLQLVQYPQHT